MGTPTCTHCNKMVNEWIHLSTVKLGAVRVAEVDGKSSPNITRQYGISGYPTLLLFRERGSMVYEHRGARDVPTMVSFVLGDYKISGEYDPAAPKPLSGKHYVYYIIGGMMSVSLCIALGVALCDPPKKKKKKKSVPEKDN